MHRFLRERAFSSAGSEHLPYKQRVGGSNPSTPTKNNKAVFIARTADFYFMMSKNNIEWVWVDLDDTVWDFGGNSWDALGELYYQEGLDAYFVSVDDWRTKYLECNHSLWPRYNRGEITKEFLQLERFRKILDDAGYPNDALIAKAKALDPLYLSILGEKSRLVEGSREMLEYLKAKGYKIGMISNGFYEVQYRKMRSSNIEHFFDVVVLSDDIGVNKPDRRIFDHALKKAGAKAETSIIIGDNPDTDIAGAVAAGWQAIYFNPKGASDGQKLPKEVRVVEKLMEIEHIL